MVILVVCTVTHFYTVSHLTAVTALKQMDREFEAVASSLKQPFYSNIENLVLWANFIHRKIAKDIIFDGLV